MLELMQCFRVDVAPTRPQTAPWRLPRFPPGAECKSVMVAERLNWHYDGKSRGAQIGIKYKVAGLLLVLLLPLYPCALRAQTTNASDRHSCRFKCGDYGCPGHSGE
jgi:hypothetical protein